MYSMDCTPIKQIMPTTSAIVAKTNMHPLTARIIVKNSINRTIDPKMVTRIIVSLVLVPCGLEIGIGIGDDVDIGGGDIPGILLLELRSAFISCMRVNVY